MKETAPTPVVIEYRREDNGKVYPFHATRRGTPRCPLTWMA